MTENVTELFQGYRRCLRQIWNAHFWQHEDLRNWDSILIFERLKPSLFQALIIERLGDPCSGEPAKMTGSFQIMPNISDNSGRCLATDVAVTKPHGGGRGWVAKVETLASSDATLCFVDFFDWSMMGYVDFRYYVAEITTFPARPDLQGYEALIDVNQADVLWVV